MDNNEKDKDKKKLEDDSKAAAKIILKRASDFANRSTTRGFINDYKKYVESGAISKIMNDDKLRKLEERLEERSSCWPPLPLPISPVAHCLIVIPAVLIGVSISATLAIGGYEYYKFSKSDYENFKTHIMEKNQELGEKISKQTGLYDYKPMSIRFEKNANGTYDMRVFGDSQDAMYGTTIPVMKNVVYTDILPEKVEKYKQALQKVVENWINNDNVLGENITLGMGDNWRDADLYSQKTYEDYINLTDDVYSCIIDALTDSYDVTNIGAVSNYMDVLDDEYADYSQNTNVSTWEKLLSDNGIVSSEYYNDKFLLTDISPVNKKGDKNYVYVNILQTDYGKNLYNAQGCFVVDGANLTSEDVYSRIENGEYNQFVKDEKQSERNSEIIENDVDLTF